jgi:hypothetical protein
MDADLIDRLTATAAGTWSQEAAIWLLDQHGHWLPELERCGLIRDVTGSISLDTIIEGSIVEASGLIGTESEWQVLGVALALYRGDAIAACLRNLASLDEHNVRLVLHAIAWSARGKTWADRQFTPPESPQITPELASHVLWHFSAGGYKPGGFTEQLLLTFAMADPQRAAQLHAAFPAHGWAMHLAQNTEQGITQLRAIATTSNGGHSTACAYVAGIGPHCTCSPCGPTQADTTRRTP